MASWKHKTMPPMRPLSNFYRENAMHKFKLCIRLIFPLRFQMTTKMASQFCRDLAVKVGYGDVCYKFWGINKPTAQKFLAVHGWLDNAGSFDPLMKHFLDSGKLNITPVI